MRISMPNGTIIEDVPEELIRSLLDITKEPEQKRERKVIVEHKKKPAIEQKSGGYMVWSVDDDKYVLDSAGKKTWKEIGRELNRTPGAIKTRYYGLKSGTAYRKIGGYVKKTTIAHNKGGRRAMHRKQWSKYDDTFLKENMDRMGVGKLSRALKRTRKAVAARIWILRQ